MTYEVNWTVKDQLLVIKSRTFHQTINKLQKRRIDGKCSIRSWFKICLASFCCILGKNGLQHFPLPGGLKQTVLILSRIPKNKSTKEKILTGPQYLGVS